MFPYDQTAAIVVHKTVVVLGDACLYATISAKMHPNREEEDGRESRARQSIAKRPVDWSLFFRLHAANVRYESRLCIYCISRMDYICAEHACEYGGKVPIIIIFLDFFTNDRLALTLSLTRSTSLSLYDQPGECSTIHFIRKHICICAILGELQLCVRNTSLHRNILNMH